MIRSALITPFGLALAMAGATPAAANDARIRAIHYDATRIVTIPGREKIQSTIVFEDGERIENIALGDAAEWQVTPNKRSNLLFLKPLTVRGRTNMTVITDRRTYMFDLTASKAAPAIYSLSFIYPAPPPTPLLVEQPKPVLLAVSAPPPPPDYNFAWSAKGAKRLLPARSFDDGRSTYLSWPVKGEVPAILAIGPDGSEGPVNYSVHGDYIVIDGTPATLVLRSGKEVATLVNGRKPTITAGPPASVATLTAER